MASYFDAQPPSKATAEVLDVPNGPLLESTGMLTPQVSRILEDFDWEEHSSSDGERSLSEDSEPDDPDKLRKSGSSSPLPESKHVTIEPPPRPLGAASRQRHPHMARFHSLRSMLFSSKIEDGLAHHEEQRAKEDAEEKWRAEHEQRRGLNRPKTPESPKAFPTKEGFTRRVSDKLRRMTSKEVPTMKDIKEENDNESTASSEDEDAHEEFVRAERGGDDDSINHSDVEGLARWVSRRDPPSDGEARRRTKDKEIPHENSGHESLGNSDVDDLVRWVSRKESEPEPEPEPGQKAKQDFDYSDASTAQDSEAVPRRKDTIGDQDVDELVRRISHKEGASAGPVRKPKLAPPPKTAKLALDSDGGGELSRWTTRRDDTSGEYDLPGDESTVLKSAPKQKHDGDARGSLANNDVDELVRWMSRKDSKSPRPEALDEEPRGRSPRREERATMTNEDVDELTRWISKRGETRQEEENRDDNIQKWKKEEDQKAKQKVGTRHGNKGSLQPADVDELVRWVSRK